MRKLIIACVVLIQIGCQNIDSKNVKTDAIQPLIIFDHKDSGWDADMRLSVTNILENDTAEILTAVSSYHGNNVGFSIALSKNKGPKDKSGNYITLMSTGKESNNLLQLLAKLYGQH